MYASLPPLSELRSYCFPAPTAFFAPSLREQSANMEILAAVIRVSLNCSTIIALAHPEVLHGPAFLQAPPTLPPSVPRGFLCAI
jgi:hypothetical protein